MTLENIIAALYALENKEKQAFKQKKFGIVAQNSLGIYHKDLKQIAAQIGTNNELALNLFDSGIYEARILSSMCFDPKAITDSLLEKWVKTFDNWEICDSFCMGLVAKSKFAVLKAIEWTSREPEFEKRAGFTTIAAYCMADKKANNEVYTQFFPLLIREAKDDRLYVKKAVNWALRSIGKRNKDLNQQAIDIAHEILKQGTKSALWIAKDALRELQGHKVNILDYPRSIYRPK